MAPRKKSSKTKTPTTAPYEWAFLLPWFRVLKGLLHVADEERIDTSPLDIGRDPETDWWLQVSWDSNLPTEDLKREKELRRRREALLLTSVLAEVDYDAWLKYLQKSCKLELPAFVDAGSKQLRPKFRFELAERQEWEGSLPSDDDDDDEPDGDSDRAPHRHAIDWEVTAKSLFGTEDFSPKFVKDYAQAIEIVQKHGPSELYTPRIQLVVLASSRTPDDVDYLISLETTLENIQAAAPSAGEPGFMLDSMTLDLTRVTLDTETAPVLQRIVELDIPIHDLHFPFHFSSEDDEHAPALDAPSWPVVLANLLCAMCGVPKTGKTRSAPIRRVCLPPIAETATSDVVALCSALQCS